MKYWLIKSEPTTWSWSDQLKVKQEMWDGVRNYQARNNLMLMKKGDLCFFYHSVKEKKIVGVTKVVKEYYQDPTDLTERFVAVDVKAIKSLENPVSLEKIKGLKSLSHLPLITQSRLSVMAIDKVSWFKILKISKKV
jgi:predicted RNA-binding protein with PUA-like domain